MSANMNPANLLPDAEESYETIASQEEIYLEVTEEEARASLTLDDPSARKTAIEYWQKRREELEPAWTKKVS